MDRKAFLKRGGMWVATQFVVIPAMVAGALWLRWSGAEAPWPGGLGMAGVAAGLAIGLGAALLLLRGIIDLGRNLTAFPMPLEDALLVDRGAYGVVRHPIYASIILAMLAVALSLNSLIGLVFAAATLMFFDRKAHFEERFLESKFPGYADYRRRVRKLIPWVY